jgi:hypothetical protein
MAHTLTDEKLAQLRDTVDRIGQNLVELETDPNRPLLETAKLSGVTAERWSAASARTTELWRWNGLLQAHVERASKLRNSKRFEELDALLDGQSIELSISDVPLTQRTLLGDSQIVDRVSIPQLLERMSAAFDEVKVVLAAIGNAWDELIPRVDAARRQVTECQQLAAALGESRRPGLDEAAKQLEALNAASTADPLSVKPAQIDALGRSVAALRAGLEADRRLKGDFEGMMASARELVGRLLGLVVDARAAHEELRIKIAASTAPPAPDVPADVDAQLARIEALAARGAWRDARSTLDAWTSSTQELVADAERTVAANRAPIESRNAQRALLDAYKAKAKALGRIEDSALAEVYAQARDELYTAPTDLGRVAELVRRYQQILDGKPATKQEPR